MTGVFDPKLPELSEHDPRLCPGREDWDDAGLYPEGAPEWMGPAPYTKPHGWQGGGSHGSTTYPRYCRWCEVTDDAVRERFRDWRYEQLVEKLTAAVTRLTNAIERKNW